MVTRLLLLALTLVSLCVASSSALAAALWATGGTALIPINVENGAIGPTVNFMGATLGYTDLAGDPASQGNLVWGVSGFGTDNRLIALNPSFKQIVSSIPITGPERIASLAIDPITGSFYGASTTSLYQISPATGAAKLIAATALDVDKALGFDLLGNLYGIANENQLVAVDKASGSTSLVATLPIFRMEDIAANPETGVMYGIGYGPNYSLYQIGLPDGSLTNLGPSLGRPNGLAFAAVPEPSAAGLMIVATVGVGFWLGSRR
jgi:hypothetical protein